MRRQLKLHPPAPEGEELLHAIMDAITGRVSLDIAAAVLLSAGCACIAYAARSDQNIDDAIRLYGPEVDRLIKLNWEARKHDRLH